MNALATHEVVVNADGYDITVHVLSVPPPHFMFLASQVESAELDPMDKLAAAGGLAAIVVRAVELGEHREPFDLPALPRTLPDLMAAGRGFIMALYELVPSYPMLGEAFTQVVGSFKAQRSANPT